MKSYVYTYKRGRQAVSGSPRHWVTVYRIKKNEPVLLRTREDVGYRSIHQAVCEVIGEVEKWGKEVFNPRTQKYDQSVWYASSQGQVKLYEV